MVQQAAQALPASEPTDGAISPRVGCRRAPADDAADQPLSRRALAEIKAAAHEALPGCDAVVCTDAARALPRPRPRATSAGRRRSSCSITAAATPATWADQLRLVRSAEPAAELVVLMEDGDLTLWRAALQVVQSPDKLTFMVTPFYRPTPRRH